MAGDTGPKRNNNKSINLKKMETKIVCPQCGAEFAIPEHERMAFATVVRKDSNLGVIHPTVVGQQTSSSTTNTTSNNHSISKRMKASEKLAALAAAGVDVSNLFSMAGLTGKETIARIENGTLVAVPDDDPVFAAIMNNGHIPNNRLFRRWVMAQVFHMMTYKSDKYGPNGFTAALNAKGFKYSWKMIVDEFRIQSKLEKKDPENFVERNRWFNKLIALEMCDYYILELNKHIVYLKRERVKYCKGVPYIRLRGRNVFFSDVNSKVFRPLLKTYVSIKKANNATTLYHGVEKFFHEIQRYWYDFSIPVSPAFKDAYKGAGAYFTMKNLILFHKASFKNGCIKLGEKKSMAMLESKAEEYKTEGWRLFGVLKKLIDDNNIDIVKKMREWKKK